MEKYIASVSNASSQPLFDFAENIEHNKTMIGYNHKTPRLVSLFSGCGGMDLGFKKAGFNIIWANDFDADAQAIYSLNLGHIDKRDILTVEEDAIPQCEFHLIFTFQMLYNYSSILRSIIKRQYIKIKRISL